MKRKTTMGAQAETARLKALRQDCMNAYRAAWEARVAVAEIIAEMSAGKCTVGHQAELLAARAARADAVTAVARLWSESDAEGDTHG